MNITLTNSVTKTINAWWPNAPKPGNFGDILTPWLIQKMCGYTCYYQNKPFVNPTLIAIGSIIQVANKDTVVWGSGLIRKDSVLNRRATYLAVRGPITRQVLLEQGIGCPDIFGDPALLLPKYYPYTNPTKKYKIGIFAHYVDTDLVTSWYKNNPDILIINPLNNDITKVIDQVFQCEKIVSSSLHGIILSQAYGIPACWVKHSDKLFGDDTKFYDYFESVKVSLNAIDFQEKISFEDMEKFTYVSDITFDPLPLLNAFPIKIS